MTDTIVVISPPVPPRNVSNINYGGSPLISQNRLSEGAYLESITLHTTGTATIEASGVWSYSGVVRAYDDQYDANSGTHRGDLGEMSTTILRALGGKEYPISIPGEIKVSGSGKR